MWIEKEQAVLKGFYTKFFVSLIIIVVAFGLVFKKFFLTPLLQNLDYYVAGIHNPINVEIQDFGIPEIFANNEHDLYFAMGFLHAKDRLWQLELQRRIAKGTLSEVFGKGSVSSDVWIRTLNIYPKASESVSALSVNSLQSLQSYSAGINAFINSGEPLPFEFTAFDISPEPWVPADSLAWVKIFALSLSGNYKAEIQRMVARQYFGHENASFLFPRDEDTSTDSLSGASMNHLIELLDDQLALESTLKIGGQYVGSNAWVVSGRHTDNGMPLLANDPHLGLQIPSLWYGVKQNLNSELISGATLVGLPVVVFGQNGHIAWGGTNMMADVQDLYIEKVNPINPNQYWSNGKWKDFTTRIETINIRPNFPTAISPKIKPIQIEIKDTSDGPVIREGDELAGAPISLRWTGLNNSDTSYETFYRINKAKNWQAFLEAGKSHIAPALNLLFADSNNNIGYKGVGLVPIRKKGDGRYPANRILSANNWESFIPYSDMPEALNPKSGYYVNANNKNTNDDYPYVISNDFAPQARARRIIQILEDNIQNDARISTELTKNMQLDTVDLSAQKLLSVLVKFTPNTELQTKAVNLLNAWNLEARENSAAASIYYIWYHHLSRYLLNDELKGYWNRQNEKLFLSSLPSLLQADQLAKLLNDESPLCDIQSTESIENCTNLMTISLDAALKDITRLKGSEPEQWALSEIQETFYKHIPFSELKLLDAVFERRIGSSGAVNTINASGTSFSESEGLEKNFGAGFRQIIQLSPTKKTHLFINSTGQSGQVMSKHYDDMIEPFENNELVDLTTLSPKRSFKLIPKQTEGSL